MRITSEANILAMTGPHTVIVEANGAKRTLQLDVTPGGLTQTIQLPDDAHALLPPTGPR